MTMQTLSHSQAHAAGDLASVGATAGRIARINESRALAASDQSLFDGALKAISSVTMTPERVAKLVDSLDKAMEADGRYSIGNGWYEMRLAVMECSCHVDADLNPNVSGEDL
jgi:hypothetical protein